ncbi:hypothetical protein MSG28_001011, partial [Choristoneura fumiferana]
MGQTGAGARAPALRQSVSEPQLVAMRPRALPALPSLNRLPPGLRTAAQAVFILAFLDFLVALHLPHRAQIGIACQEPKSQLCMVWPRNNADTTEAAQKLHRVPPQYVCGLSDLKAMQSNQNEIL